MKIVKIMKNRENHENHEKSRKSRKSWKIMKIFGLIPDMALVAISLCLDTSTPISIAGSLYLKMAFRMMALDGWPIQDGVR